MQPPRSQPVQLVPPERSIPDVTGDYADFEDEPDEVLTEFLEPEQPATPRPIASRAAIAPAPAASFAGKGLTTQQAFELARERGCTKTKEAFRSWSKRNPVECERLYGLRVLPNQSRDNTAPSYEDVRS